MTEPARRRMLSFRPMRNRGLQEVATVVGVAAALAVVMSYPLAFGLGTLGRIDTGDGQFSIWNVAWVAHALITDPLHVFDANIFYPHTGTLAYAESNLLAGLIAVPAYWLTGNAYAAHNAAALVSFILSATGMYYLARYLTGSRPAAAVAGVLFAFCPFIYARTAHIQLMMTAGLPFTLLAAHRMIDRPLPGRAIVLGLTLAATALGCGYYGVFGGLLVGFACLFYAVARSGWRNVAFYAAVACAAAVAVLAIWPFYEPYRMLQSGGQPFRALEESRDYSANVAAYLAADGWGNAWLKTAALSLGAARWKEVLFPGLVTVALALVGVGMGRRDAAALRATDKPRAPHERQTTLFYGLVILLAGWLSFGPVAGLYTVMYRVAPAFSLLRAPGRFGIVVTLGFVVLASLGAARLLRGRSRQWAAASAICLVALAELATLPLPYKRVEPTAAPYLMLSKLPAGAVAEFPFFYRPIDFHRHASYMLNSTAHWKPLVNGYSDFIPVDFNAMAVPVSSFPVLQAFDILKKRGTRYVVFHFDEYDYRNRQKVLERIDLYHSYLRKLASEGDLALYEIVAWPDRELVRP